MTESEKIIYSYKMKSLDKEKSLIRSRNLSSNDLTAVREMNDIKENNRKLQESLSCLQNELD